MNIHSGAYIPRSADSGLYVWRTLQRKEVFLSAVFYRGSLKTGTRARLRTWIFSQTRRKVAVILYVLQGLTTKYAEKS